MRTVNLILPHSWEELSERQLLFVSSLYLQGLTRNAFLTKAFICLSGLRILPGRYGDRENPVYRFRKKGEKAFPMSMGEILDFCRKCEFLLEYRENFSPLPVLAGRKALNTLMYDACFGQFISAMVYYNQFKDPEQDRHFLDKLCAVMYPAGLWDPDNIRQEEFACLPLHVCYTVFLWFGTVMNVVSRECPGLFREASDDAEPVSLRENIHAMYNLVTEHDITKEKEVARLEMWRVLYDMDEKARRIKEMNERLEQHGRV
jgi:hypothetical protein|nr:MAG TPA: hypothetical protein [Caudoviricetes sp.]